jgi:hypothetical protein
MNPIVVSAVVTVATPVNRVDAATNSDEKKVEAAGPHRSPIIICGSDATLHEGTLQRVRPAGTG